MTNQFDDIDIFDTSQDVGSIDPIQPQLGRGLMDVYLDYLVQDPVAQQVTGGSMDPTSCDVSKISMSSN